ncbi:MAG TPA: universal stress protein [Bdellovibrionales bacterium]|nr:universal stress protein [Bdellovibrionales bacterium]
MKPLLLADDLRTTTPIDQNRTRLIRAWARYFAEALGAPLRAATVLESDESAWEQNMLHGSVSKLLARARVRENEEGKLEAVASKIGAHPLFMVGSPVDQLSKIARPSKFQMMVIGTHGRTGIKRLFLGSVAEEVVRRAEIPTCVLGPKLQELGTMPARSKKHNVLVAVDFGRGSASAEKFAINLAKQLDAKITLVHCAYQGQDPMLQMALNTPDGHRAVGKLFEELNRSVAQQMKKKVAKIQAAGIECRGVIDHKSVFAYRAVENAITREKATLVVTGTHGRTLLGQAFFGSTARQTILRSPVPVIVVRSR